MNFPILLTLSLVLIGSARSETQDENVILICKQEPIELGIVLDSSSSILQKDFQTGKEFLQNFVRQYDINSGREGVRVSIITFGRGIYPQDAFNLTTYNSKEEVVDAIGAIPHRAGLYTDTGKAIEFMHNHQLSPDVVRPYAEKVGLVITDGNSQEWRFTKQAAEDARADGITMFAVGVGQGVREEELLNIAGDDSRVTKVDNYNRLGSILQSLARRTCIQKVRPTTPPPMTQTCGEANPADVYFVFSPADLGSEATSWTTSFISHTISSRDMDTGFRYGAMTGTCPEDEGFDLDAYDNVDDIRTRIDSYSRSRVHTLVERVRKQGYTEERGAREDARNVAVVVARGGKKGQESLQEEVNSLVAEGVTVYVADPNGSGVQVEGAVTLTGRSSRQQSEALVSALCPEE